MNKIVISTYSTGSAINLIENNNNGYLYNSYDHKELTRILSNCIINVDKKNMMLKNENFQNSFYSKMSNYLYDNLNK